MSKIKVFCGVKLAPASADAWMNECDPGWFWKKEGSDKFAGPFESETSAAIDALLAHTSEAFGQLSDQLARVITLLNSIDSNLHADS